MVKLSLKIVIFNLIFGTLGAFSIMPCTAQTLTSGLVEDPEVLVSPSDPSNNTSRTNLEPSLVDIKAVDASALQTVNGKTGVGSQERFGQGIIIDPNGIIATNMHIIGNAQRILVALSSGKIYVATVLRKTQTDLCFIKINVPFALRAISWGDPSEIQKGSNVFAIANASFNPQRKLGGQIIKVFKEVASNNTELVEMNIPLKAGDSGGPILNEEGSLLGLIMGKQISDPSKSYAIPSSRIQQEYFNYRNSILS